jgi:hypothetical protein
LRDGIADAYRWFLEHRAVALSDRISRRARTGA